MDWGGAIVLEIIGSNALSNISDIMPLFSKLLKAWTPPVLHFLSSYRPGFLLFFSVSKCLQQISIKSINFLPLALLLSFFARFHFYVNTDDKNRCVPNRCTSCST